ncbi:hypothetical protein FDF50_18445 [Clostridium botulinum]|uniref:Uncharacterized protein n=1 Tax=Clostridium botulinum TaxID=1491 RepID=A0A6G4HXS2_CLOBO|nr:hypothetical protein [Clostridium botulinum]MBD5589598.1 hypothetical protein [Clostridium botulinum]NFI47790.1 hypothetical protein [Clostridium botulinum]NFJ62574.1 hypothetical protein [Clostridium botulinum]NFJ69681.1 hypothetical protein [Clostridium botulinum]NFJ91796.1 hypothetical protein [Clostridium botulinum]
MKNKNKIIKIILFLLIIISLIIIINSKNNIHVGILFSDAGQKDSEIKLLDKKLNIKKDIKFKAIDSPMVSCINKNIYIPTGFDNKLYHIDKNFKISEKKVSDGGSYIKIKKDFSKLILYNLPINDTNGDVNRVYFSSGNKDSHIDIKKSLLLCGDFDEKFIYVVGQKFFSETNIETYLFIIDINSFKLIKEIKFPDRIAVKTAELVDDKLLISSDSSVDYFLYYDIKGKKLIKDSYNKDFIKDPLEINTILHNKNSIFFISFTGDIIKLNRKTLSFEKKLKLKNKIIVSGDIKENRLYLLSQKEENNQVALVDIIDGNNLKQIKENLINPIRNTMPRDIFIYK